MIEKDSIFRAYVGVETLGSLIPVIVIEETEGPAITHHLRWDQDKGEWARAFDPGAADVPRPALLVGERAARKAARLMARERRQA